MTALHFVFVLSHKLYVLLRVGDFIGFEISSEAVAICCFSALQTAGGFHGATKGNSQSRLAFQPAAFNT